MKIGICAIALVALGALALPAIEISKLPAAVQKTVKEETKNATAVKVSKETEGGKTLYEVESKVKGRGRDLMLDSQGMVLSIEEEMALADIPPAARAGIEKLAMGGTIGKIEAVTKGKLVIYEAVITRKGMKKTEVMVNGDGSIANLVAK